MERGMTIFENILWGAVGGVIGAVLTNLFMIWRRVKIEQDVRELLRRKEPGQ